MRKLCYKLVGREAVPCSPREWLDLFKINGAQHIADTEIGRIRISTVFLGIDQAFGGGPPPLLFESMVFAGYEVRDMDRYSTYEQALAGHNAMVERARAAQAQLKEATK